MRTRQVLAASALLYVGTLLGLLASGRLPLHAQEPRAVDTHGWLGTETVKTRVGNFDFKNGYPTPSAAETLLDQHKFNRAVEVYLTHLPSVSIIETRRGIHEFGANKSNQAV